jgi:YjjI family glycine radical enzyme
MNKSLNIIKDPLLTYEQKVMSLARAAENSLSVLNIPKKTQQYRDKRIICDLYEGCAPYRPRYILPDYKKFMTEGSKFLGLKPPADIWEAVNSLLIFYKHVPSITGFPVYLGNIDYLLEPFINDRNEAFKAIKLFLTHIDRTLTDSFCHANIGPLKTRAGTLILKAERELEDSIPNITLKYSNDTPDDFVLDAIVTALDIAKPSFANHYMFLNELGNNYAIASCYNGLQIGGGSYTLVRLNLANLAKETNNLDEFMNKILPEAVKMQAEYIEERIRFLVKESPFFESNFLVKESLISIDRFTAMFGLVGLAQCVNHFIDSEKQQNRFGHCKHANNLGLQIIEKLKIEVEKFSSEYCPVSNNKFLLHAQVGISDDKGITPGCRIPINDEPELYRQMQVEAEFHKFFPSGIGNVYPFEPTAKKNPQAILDVLKGAFKIGMRYFSIHSSDADVIRISGYLVKKSEIEKLNNGKQVLRDTVVLGKEAVENLKILDRKVR